MDGNSLPFNLSLSRRSTEKQTILVVATEGSLSLPEDLETFTDGKNAVNVRIAHSLPLRSGENHPPFDALAFVYQVSNEGSLNTIRQSLPYVNWSCFIGKCFILAFSDFDFQSKCHTQDIEELAASFRIPIHFLSRQKDPARPDSKPRLALPSELLSVYCPPANSDVSSLMVDAAIRYAPTGWVERDGV